jgi:hypothetical protein
MLHCSIIIRRATPICLPIEAGHLAGLDRRIPMKTMILAAFAALSLGVGGAYAQGAPAGYFRGDTYSSQAFSDHRNDPVVHFLGKDTVLGKMFRYNSNSEQVAAATTSAKGG